MSEPEIFTIEDLKEKLRTSVSPKRYIHSLGVAETTQRVLDHYRCTNYEKEWNGFEAGEFCGLVHDLAREFTDGELLAYCAENGIELSDEMLRAPLLAHGCVSAHIAQRLCGNYPESWKRAVCAHTTGAPDMDDLALALFVADYIEPSRPFLTDQKRAYYYSQPSLLHCEYAILCDMMKHWKEKGKHDPSVSSQRLKAELEEKLGIRAE